MLSWHVNEALLEIGSEWRRVIRLVSRSLAKLSHSQQQNAELNNDFTARREWDLLHGRSYPDIGRPRTLCFIKFRCFGLGSTCSIFFINNSEVIWWTLMKGCGLLEAEITLKISALTYCGQQLLSAAEIPSHIDHFRITAIWPGDRIRRPEHPTENEVRRRSCDESV